MFNWLNAKVVLFLCGFFLCATVFAAETAADKLSYSEQKQQVAEQTLLLKNRLLQAKNELANLRNQQENNFAKLSSNQTSKALRKQIELDIAAAQSNLDSISIELAESEQAVSRLEKNIQVIENQINVFRVFGLKIARHEALNVPALREELAYQTNILALEKNRGDYLLALQKVADTILQSHKTRYAEVNALLKSRVLLRIKEKQAADEVDFAQQQNNGLQQLHDLYQQLNQNPHLDSATYNKLQQAIAYTNEKVNFSYLQLLIVRYEDQLRELQLSVAHSSSISLLNKSNEEAQSLTKQLVRVKDTLNTRMNILSQRDFGDASLRDPLLAGYVGALNNVDKLNQQLLNFHASLDQALQYELSSRQGLPGLSAKAWLDLGEEFLLVPTLTFQVVKSLSHAVLAVLKNMSYFVGVLWLCGELLLLFFIMQIRRLLKKIIGKMAEHEFGHVNLKRLCMQLLQRNVIEMGLLLNAIGLFVFFAVPAQSFSFVINLALVWLLFKGIINMARLCLVETAHDRAGRDVRLYHWLKWTFLVGGGDYGIDRIYVSTACDL